MWFQHLRGVQNNRRKGARKETETQKKTRGKKAKRRTQVVSEEEVCMTCLAADPVVPYAALDDPLDRV